LPCVKLVRDGPDLFFVVIKPLHCEVQTVDGTVTCGGRYGVWDGGDVEARTVVTDSLVTVCNFL
jgi:hypothetical protein